MPSLTYEAYQAGFYQDAYPDERERKLRAEMLQREFDPLGKGMYVWITKQERVIPLPFMTPLHLRNSYRAVYRQITALAERDIYTMSLDIASYLVLLIDTLAMLRQEILRRKLQAPAWDEKMDELRHKANLRAHRRIGRAYELIGNYEDYYGFGLDYD